MSEASLGPAPSPDEGQRPKTILKVYIDGVLTWACKNNPGGSNNYTAGLFSRVTSYQDSSVQTPPITLTGFSNYTKRGLYPAQYPFTDLTNGGANCLVQPIAFKSSLRVTVQSDIALAVASPIWVEYSRYV